MLVKGEGDTDYVMAPVQHRWPGMELHCIQQGGSLLTVDENYESEREEEKGGQPEGGREGCIRFANGRSSGWLLDFIASPCLAPLCYAGMKR